MIARVFLFAALFLPMLVHAQAPEPAQACERAAGAPAWLPCGPDRVLSEADIKAFLHKEGTVAKMKIKGGDSGRMFFADFYPDGKMDAGPAGTNIGKSWTMEGNKVCRNYYRFYVGPQCGTYELAGGVLFVVDADKSRNPVTEIEFVKR